MPQFAVCSFSYGLKLEPSYSSPQVHTYMISTGIRTEKSKVEQTCLPIKSCARSVRILQEEADGFGSFVCGRSGNCPFSSSPFFLGNILFESFASRAICNIFLAAIKKVLKLSGDSSN